MKKDVQALRGMLKTYQSLMNTLEAITHYPPDHPAYKEWLRAAECARREASFLLQVTTGRFPPGYQPRFHAEGGTITLLFQGQTLRGEDGNVCIFHDEFEARRFAFHHARANAGAGG